MSMSMLSFWRSTPSDGVDSVRCHVTQGGLSARSGACTFGKEWKRRTTQQSYTATVLW